MAERPTPYSWCSLLLLTHCSPPPPLPPPPSLLLLPPYKELLKGLPANLRAAYAGHLESLVAEYLESLDAFIGSFSAIATPLQLTGVTALPQPPGGTLAGTVARGSEGISPTSERGVRIRQVILGFEMSSFETVSRIYCACKAYTADPALPPPTPLLSHLPPSHVAAKLTSSCLSLSATLGSSPSSFESLEAELSSLAPYHPSLPQAHFLSYLNHLSHNSFPEALASLHRYFDYTHSREQAHPIQ